MPVSVSSLKDPFRGPAPTAPPGLPTLMVALRVPQARLLQALVPKDPTSYWTEWPLLSRAALGVRAGYTAVSGTVNRALRGIARTCSTGEAHLGLLGLGLVVEVEVDVDGLRELGYRATPLGVEAYRAYLAQRGGALPGHRDKAISVNTNRGYENPHL